MSDINDLKKNFAEDLVAANLMEEKLAQIRKDELEIKAFRIEAQKRKIEETQRNLELQKNTKFGMLDDSEIEKMIKESEDYIDAARNAMPFIDPDAFKNVVPFFRKNLILIGAKTGEGKSTAVANIVRMLISQKNKLTGKLNRVLVITNEEKREDFYNRITCLIKGWHYTNHDKFTEEQKRTFSEYIRLLSRLITVVDDSHGGGSGMTTTLEGIDMIFSNSLRDMDHYDAVIIDYYQNVNASQKNPMMNQYDVQAALASLLDKYKNIYPAPIVMMAQIKPAEKDEEDNSPIEHRIKGRKQALVVATFVLEMVAERDRYRTKWIIHKGRFSEGVGTSFYTGYDRGRFVAYDDAFKQKALKMAEDKQRAAMNKAAGTDFMNIKKEEPKKEEPTGGSDGVQG